MKIKLIPSFLILILGIALGAVVTFAWNAGAHPWLALVLRVGLALITSMLSVLWAQQKRPQAAVSGLLVSAFESVLWRALYVHHHMATGTFGDIVVGLGMGYLGIVPVLAIICFGGAELGKFFKDKLTT